MDVIAANTPAEFVLQLDVGTCVEGGSGSGRLDQRASRPDP